jgi:lambda family phage portal protein
MGMLDIIRSAIRVATGSPSDGAPVSRPSVGARYFKGERNPILFGWRPHLRDAQEDITESWDVAAARAVDTIQNSGFIAGTVAASCSLVVGSGLKLAARPDAELLGWDEAAASEWSRSVERLWEAYSRRGWACDAGGRMSFGQMQQLAYRSWLAYGEILALIVPAPRRADDTVTKVLMLPPHRLKRETRETERLIEGVFTDAFGAPVSYLFRTKDRYSIEQDRRVAAFDRQGRQQVIHLFDPELGTTRGISPLAPVLKVTKQIDQYADATLTAALLQTIFAVTVRSDMAGISAFEGMMTEGEQGALDIAAFGNAKADWYDSSKIDLYTHGRIAHLFPNDHMEFHEAKQPAQAYDGFMAWLMREVARCAGVTYETATGDFRGATYSSVRMAGSEMWNIVRQRRENLIVPFCQMVYEAWMDEQVATGRVQVPGGYEGFLAMRDAYCRAFWNGPVKPQADDLKTAKAFEALKAIGVATYQHIGGEYGVDWKDVFDQQAREREYALALGLPDPYPDPQLLPKAQAGKLDRESEALMAGEGEANQDG